MSLFLFCTKEILTGVVKMFYFNMLAILFPLSFLNGKFELLYFLNAMLTHHDENEPFFQFNIYNFQKNSAFYLNKVKEQYGFEKF